jgi:hypothetical protein
MLSNLCRSEEWKAGPATTDDARFGRVLDENACRRPKVFDVIWARSDELDISANVYEPVLKRRDVLLAA